MSSSLFENQTTNLKNVYTDISFMSKKGMLLRRFKEQYTLKKKEEYSFDKNFNDVNKGDVMKEDKEVTTNNPLYYKHVIFDRMREFWYYNLKDLTFLQAFEFTINGEQLKIPGIIDKKKDSGSTNFSQKLYEITFERCLLLINFLIKTYCRSRYLDFERYEIEYHKLKELKNESEEKEFNAEEKFLELLEKLKNYDCNLPKFPEQGASIKDEEKYENKIEEVIKPLKVYFSKFFLKALVGEQEDDEKTWQQNLKVYTERYYDLMNEIGKFLKRYDFTNYSFIEKKITYTMKKKKIIGFYFNFEKKKELNTDEWFYVNIEDNTKELTDNDEDVETKENKNSVKEDIKYSDLEFTNKTSEVVEINNEFIEIYKNSEKKQFLVLIDMEELKRKKISYILFKGNFKCKEYKVCIENAYDILHQQRKLKK